MTGPFKSDRPQPDPVSRGVFEALTESDTNPVWKAFVRFICNPGPEDYTALAGWSDRTIAAVTNAIAYVEQMRAAAKDFTRARIEVAACFSDLEGAFIEHILEGPQSEEILCVAYGFRQRHTESFFIKRIDIMHFVGTTNEIVPTGPYLSLEECISYVREYMIGRCRNSLVSINFTSPIPTAFIEEVIIAACPLMGTLFTINGKLCVRSSESPFLELGT